MATKQMLERTFKINSADVYVIGDVGPHGGTITLQIDSVLFAGSITLKARATGASAWLPIPYTKLYLNRAVGDGTIVSTAITDTSLIQVVVSEGMDLALDCGTYTSGSMLVRANLAAAL